MAQVGDITNFNDSLQLLIMSLGEARDLRNFALCISKKEL